MSAPTLVVYSTPTCGSCRMAKGMLAGDGIEFEAVDLTEVPEKLEELKGRLGVPKVNVPLFEYRGELHSIVELGRIRRELKI